MAEPDRIFLLFAAVLCAVAHRAHVGRFIRQRDWNWVQYALADFAELAAAEGQAERALRLGAAVPIWEAHGYSIQPSERGRFERWMETARGALTSEAAAAAWAEGEAMSIDQALTYAQGVLTT